MLKYLDLGITNIHMLVLGVLQGIFEWLPISSKTVVMLYSYFVMELPIEVSYAIGLGVQGGAVFAASIYFRRELFYMLSFRDRGRLAMFLAVATAVTGLVGVLLYILYLHILKAVGIGIITIVIGFLLLIQARLHKMVKGRSKTIANISLYESIIFGAVQGLAAAPGISRSGTTTVLLLFLGYSVEDSLKLSFLASIPVNIGATFLTFLIGKQYAVSFDISAILIPLLVSAVISFAVISLLIDMAKRYRYRLATALGITTLIIGTSTALVAGL